MNASRSAAPLCGAALGLRMVSCRLRFSGCGEPMIASLRAMSDCTSGDVGSLLLLARLHGAQATTRFQMALRSGPTHEPVFISA